MTKGGSREKWSAHHYIVGLHSALRTVCSAPELHFMCMGEGNKANGLISLPNYFVLSLMQSTVSSLFISLLYLMFYHSNHAETP